jgi:HAD superfamily hydrolase (TIGR01509 family)
MPPRFLYFDMGNVLLSFSHERMCSQMAAVAGVEPETVRAALFDAAESLPSLQWRFERGDIDTDAVYEALCAATGGRPERAALYAAANDMFAELPESVALVRRLHAAGNRLGVLSNTNPVDFEFARERFPFLRECFELAVVSYEAREMKPHRAIYEYAARIAGVAPHEVLFTDDREENVVGAIEAGLDAVRFTSAAQFEAELEARGVSIAD